MSIALPYLLPMAMMLPVMPAEEAHPTLSSAYPESAVHSLQEKSKTPAQTPATEEAERQTIWFPFSQAYRPLVLRQSQVRGRIVIRVSARRTSPTTPARPSQRSDYREIKMGKCVKANSIAWMHPDNQRLIFVMNNRTLVSARLNKKCRAKDFYSGFYVERHKDGKLCVKRDELQSRAGSKCKLRSFRQLVRNAT